MMNRRHKAILFLTLIMTGSSLLAGATLSEGFGMLMLGGACAWLIGSETANRVYRYLRGIPGTTWPWFRVLVFMALGGFLFVAVVVSSTFNPFLVSIAMAAFGMLLSRLLHFPTQRVWLRAIGWLAAILIFFIATVGAATLIARPQDAEPMGRAMVYGLIALGIGVSWLSRGWKLIQVGIQSEPEVNAIQSEDIGKRNGTAWLYLGLVLGITFLTLCLALLTFSAFSEFVYGPQLQNIVQPANQQNAMSPINGILTLTLLAWWPYA